MKAYLKYAARNPHNIRLTSLLVPALADIKEGPVQMLVVYQSYAFCFFFTGRDYDTLLLNAPEFLTEKNKIRRVKKAKFLMAAKVNVYQT
jgi:hypothetical protein